MEGDGLEQEEKWDKLDAGGVREVISILTD